MAPNLTSAEVTFHIRKDGVEDVEKVVKNGEGLRFVGRFQPSRSAFLPRVPLMRGDLVVIGAPPSGTTNEDLKTGGIVGAVKLRDVCAMSPTGDWEHVSASAMRAPLGKAAKSLESRKQAHAPKKPSPEAAPASGEK